MRAMLYDVMHVIYSFFFYFFSFLIKIYFLDKNQIKSFSNNVSNQPTSILRWAHQFSFYKQVFFITNMFFL